MPNIIKMNFLSKSKNEDKFLELFINYYYSKYFPELTEENIFSPDGDGNNEGPSPDFYLKNSHLLIEVKRVLDRKDQEITAAYILNLERLNKVLETADKSFLDGYYFVRVPMGIRVRRGEESDVINQILESIKNRKNELFIPNSGTLEITKWEKKEGRKNDVLLSFGSRSGSINSAQIIRENTEKQIFNANEQLGNFSKGPISKRILLFVNQYMFGDLGDYLNALSGIFTGPTKYPNLDEMWLQTKENHELLLEKEFLTAYEGMQFDDLLKHIELFRKWLKTFNELGDIFKEKIFKIIKELLKTRTPEEVFPLSEERQIIIRLADWLVNQKRIDDIHWLVGKFINDSDPGDPKTDKSSNGYKYHEKILNKEYGLPIDTVLGSLAWRVGFLTNEEKFILDSFNFTRRLIEHENLYIKFQAIIPFISIARRRFWLNGWKKFPRREEYGLFSELAFKYLELLNNHRGWTDLADHLIDLFMDFCDLTTEEAIYVFETLRAYKDSSHLLTFFALYRSGSFKDVDGLSFDSTYFKREMMEVLESGKKDDENLRSELAWQFWSILHSRPKEFHFFRPYIDQLMKGPFSRGAMDKVQLIVTDHLEAEPQICIQWFSQILEKIQTFNSGKEKLPLEHLFILHSEEVFEVVLKKFPEKLIPLMKDLFEIWNKGGSIGHPVHLLKLGKSLNDSNINNELRIILEKMGSVNPHLKAVSWESI